MKLEQVLGALDEGPAFESLQPGWEASVASLPDGAPAFLDSGHLRETMTYTDIARAEYDPVLRMAKRILSDPALKHLAWHCRHLLYSAADYSKAQLNDWPRLTRALGADANYFYFILALASVDFVRDMHAERRLPAGITQATCADVWRFLPCYVGVRVRIPNTLAWLCNATSGNLFKIGRHQYIREGFRGPLRIFRHGTSGAVIAILEGGLRFDRTGHFAGHDAPHGPDTWTTHLEMNERQVRGFPVAPMGYAVRREIRLPLNAWHLVLFRDTPVLAMHIPPAEPMPPQVTAQSMRRAWRFFHRYYPERTIRAFACQSWLFNPQIADILGEDSNIAAWQREQYLYPVFSRNPAGLEFIFGQTPFDLETAPRDTRLRRGIIALLERGDPLRNGGMFGLPEDLPHFGSQYYRERWNHAHNHCL